MHFDKLPLPVGSTVSEVHTDKVRTKNPVGNHKPTISLRHGIKVQTTGRLERKIIWRDRVEDDIHVAILRRRHTGEKYVATIHPRTYGGGHYKITCVVSRLVTLTNWIQENRPTLEDIEMELEKRGEF